MSRFIGNIIEEYAFDTFNLDTCGYNKYCDAIMLNIPIEIKGILKNPIDNVMRNKNGRVWITNRNHHELIKNKGLYLFIIYKYFDMVYEYDIKNYHDINICYTLFIAAHRIKINSGINTKISYKKLLKLL